MTDEAKAALERVEVIIDSLSLLVEAGHQEAVPLLLEVLSIRRKIMGLE